MTNEVQVSTEDKIEALSAIEDLFDMFAVDKKRATGGAPMKVGNSTFMIARATQPRYVAARSRLLMETQEKFGEDADEDTEEGRKHEDEREAYYQERHQKIVAKHLIVGWDKIKFKGEVVEGYRKDIAEALAAMDDFLQAVVLFAHQRSNYAPSVEAEDAKN